MKSSESSVKAIMVSISCGPLAGDGGLQHLFFCSLLTHAQTQCQMREKSRSTWCWFCWRVFLKSFTKTPLHCLMVFTLFLFADQIYILQCVYVCSRLAKPCHFLSLQQSLTTQRNTNKQIGVNKPQVRIIITASSPFTAVVWAMSPTATITLVLFALFMSLGFALVIDCADLWCAIPWKSLALGVGFHMYNI